MIMLAKDRSDRRRREKNRTIIFKNKESIDA